MIFQVGLRRNGRRRDARSIRKPRLRPRARSEHRRLASRQSARALSRSPWRRPGLLRARSRRVVRPYGPMETFTAGQTGEQQFTKVARGTHDSNNASVGFYQFAPGRRRETVGTTVDLKSGLTRLSSCCLAGRISDVIGHPAQQQRYRPLPTDIRRSTVVRALSLDANAASRGEIR